MTPIEEFRACALHMIKQHGDDAETRAAQRADELLDEGDVTGELAWLAILRHIQDLRLKAPRLTLQ